MHETDELYSAVVGHKSFLGGCQFSPTQVASLSNVKQDAAWVRNNIKSTDFNIKFYSFSGENAPDPNSRWGKLAPPASPPQTPPNPNPENPVSTFV